MELVEWGVSGFSERSAPHLERVSSFTCRSNIEVETKTVFACNVVGMLRGRDPKLSKEIVGIGSHLDHIGKRGTVINNGADDDGSGTTGVLAVARAFAKNKIKPKRSLLFMAFCGEEMGLIGSNYYVEHPLFENSSMVAELQMDMIGRNEERARRSKDVDDSEKAEDNINCLHLVGTKKLSDEMHQICLAANEKYGRFAIEYDEENVFGRSDHKNFARKDIPIAFFFTGFHPQYHKPDDTVEILSDDIGILEDLPAWCRSHGHTLVDLSEAGLGEYRGLVRKSGA